MTQSFRYLLFITLLAVSVAGYADCDCNPCDCNPCECVQTNNECDESSCPRRIYGYEWNSFCWEPVDACVADPSYCAWGMALPPGPIYISPLADPRRLALSAGWRFDDCNFDNNLAAVSYGDYCGLYRWVNPFGCRGFLQFGIEGGLWAIFEQCRESAPLVNADYYVGFPLTYAIDNWVFRLRGFHISSHLGDEFLIDHPGFDRRNPSSEYIDFAASCQWTCDLRLFAVVGLIARSDETWPMKKFYAEYGFDYYFNWLRYTARTGIEGKPFLGAFFRTRAQNDYDFDGTFVLGYEWGRPCYYLRKLRLFLEYHDGFSFEGQFETLRTNYYSLTASWAY